MKIVFGPHTLNIDWGNKSQEEIRKIMADFSQAMYNKQVIEITIANRLIKINSTKILYIEE